MTQIERTLYGADGGPSRSDEEADDQPADVGPLSRNAPPEVYSLRDVAEMFGRTERTIRNWVRAGHLQRGGFGHAVFFSRAAIEALLSGEVGAKKAPDDH